MPQLRPPASRLWWAATVRSVPRTRQTEQELKAGILEPGGSSKVRRWRRSPSATVASVYGDGELQTGDVGGGGGP